MYSASNKTNDLRSRSLISPKTNRFTAAAALFRPSRCRPSLFSDSIFSLVSICFLFSSFLRPAPGSVAPRTRCASRFLDSVRHVCVHTYRPFRADRRSGHVCVFVSELRAPPDKTHTTADLGHYFRSVRLHCALPRLFRRASARRGKKKCKNKFSKSILTRNGQNRLKFSFGNTLRNPADALFRIGSCTR